MARLPQPGGDSGSWGSILNDYLAQVHNIDGTLKDNSVTAAALAPGAVTAAEIADGTVTEAKLDTAVQTKLNIGGGSGVASVNTHTGVVTLTKSDIGLTNVDNTSDTSKPVSTAMQAALNTKASTSSLAAVALSGDYNDLTNKPTIPTVTGTNTGDQTLAFSSGNLTISGSNGNTVSIPTGTIADGTLTPTKLASDTPISGELLSYSGSGFEWISPPAAGGGGETNTASNIGTGGVGVYKQKSGVNFELKSVRAGSNKLSVTDNTGNNTLDLDVVPANLGLTKSSVGLANVDNTTDANKPISSATQTALNGKANTSHTHSGSDLTDGTVTEAKLDSAVQTKLNGSGVTSVNTRTGAVTLTKTDVGLANVDNTTDANKPVSSATLTALNLKAPLASPTFTGTVSGITKAMVGLSNVDNTSDANKPISTDTQTALDAKANAALTLNAQTGTTYTTVLADAGKMVTLTNASAITATIPPNSSVAYPVGARLLIAQLGAGQVTFAPGAGVSLNSRGAALKTAGQYSVAELVKTATNAWLVVGDLTT
jgi:hypothetical protein